MKFVLAWLLTLVKKAQVVKGVIDDFYSFAAQETRKVTS
jgi:hypothetical protein